jgi:tRNA/rRNA methyltransferase
VFGPTPSLPWLERIAVVLVRPQGPANLGMIARAMKNFGLTRLRVVGPAPLGEREAVDHACHAADVLARAETFADLDGALADRALVVGTSIPRVGLPDRHELDAPRAAAARVRAAAEAGNGVALVFGPENHGLTTEELARSHRVISIPAHPDYPVLNLAQSVMLIAYEIFMTAAPLPLPPAWADRRELEAMEADLAATFVAAGFVGAEGVDRSLIPLRRLFSRAGMTTRDVRWVRWLARKLRNRFRDVSGTTDEHG